MREAVGTIFLLLVLVVLVVLLFGLFRPWAVLPRRLQRTKENVVRIYGFLAALCFIVSATLLIQMAGFLIAIFLLCPLLILIGLIRPMIVLPAGHRTRVKAFMVYGILWVASFAAIGIMGAAQQNNAVVPAPSPAVVAPASPEAAAPSISPPSPEPTPEGLLTASTLAEQAQAKAKAAKTTAEWEAVIADWELGVKVLEQVLPESQFYSEAQTRIKEFQANRTAAQQALQVKQAELAEAQRQQELAAQQEAARQQEIQRQQEAQQQEQTAQAPVSGGPIREPYSGKCDCPYDTDRAGRRCGERSAYSRPGGSAPVCYVGEQ